NYWNQHLHEIEEKFLLDKKYMTATENEALKQRVAKDMEEAEEFALNAPFPAMDEAATGVYAD
ncbi:MAG TPA: hypothetical protein PLL93_07600, partial [bacterium]|nr:hypothetical protein [bacterium]